MDTQRNEPVAVLREAVAGQHPVDDSVMTSAVILSDRLAMLKQSSPLFDAVAFSPMVEDMMAEQMTVAAN